MKEVAFAEDDECWSIAERMIEEIGLIKGKKDKQAFEIFLAERRP
jgi:hypothetical protein